jgi:hypothetical protein
MSGERDAATPFWFHLRPRSRALLPVSLARARLCDNLMDMNGRIIRAFLDGEEEEP